MLTFEITDTGVGIALQDQKLIFEPFTRMNNVTASRGTGLGLSITRQYVEMMGGNIRLESTLGKGSRFSVNVPVELAAESENDPVRISALRIVGLASGQPEYRVLIIDDRADDRSILRRILEQAGFHVQVAETGESGIEMFKVWRPHLIWMDRRLPGMDGLKAARCIRTMRGGSDVKIVGLSASVFVSEREEMLAAGLDDFVRKPYLPREIFDCMAQHIGVRYIYWAEPQAVVGDHSGAVRPQELAALPATMRDELENAVILLDRDRIALLVGQISEQNASLGSALARLADRFTYTPILHALASCKARLPEQDA